MFVSGRSLHSSCEVPWEVMLPIPVNMMFRQAVANNSPVAHVPTVRQDNSHSSHSFTQSEIADLERVLPKSPVRKSGVSRDSEMPDLDLETMLAPNSPIRDGLQSPLSAAAGQERLSVSHSDDLDTLLLNAASNVSNIKSKNIRVFQKTILP